LGKSRTEACFCKFASLIDSDGVTFLATIVRFTPSAPLVALNPLSFVGAV